MSDTKTPSSPASSHGFDPAVLDRYLRASIPGLDGEMALTRISGGQSNPTFFVSYPNRRMVLRKRPAGPVLPSAHAIDREYRVMSALADTDVPVPSMVLYEAEPDIIGTSFYVMDRLEGRVFSDCSLPGVPPGQRHSMFMAMAETLAKLHRVDWKAVGLGDFGKSGAYFARQLDRWTRQWRDSKTRELPDIDALIAWFPDHLPADDVTTIAHGDFRIGNLMFHPTEPRVIGVLDWELSTLGHPLADLAYSALAWRLGTDEYMGMHGLDLASLGIPAEQAYLDRYQALMPDAGHISSFHFAFALFRLAVIFEGIAARARTGAASSDNAAEVGRLSAVFARRAIEALASH
jgi:aminoglycoside phosphotransferase (APT) family kinase protein